MIPSSDTEHLQQIAPTSGSYFFEQGLTKLFGAVRVGADPTFWGCNFIFNSSNSSYIAPSSSFAMTCRISMQVSHFFPFLLFFILYIFFSPPGARQFLSYSLIHPASIDLSPSSSNSNRTTKALCLPWPIDLLFLCSNSTCRCTLHSILRSVVVAFFIHAAAASQWTAATAPAREASGRRRQHRHARPPADGGCARTRGPQRSAAALARMSSRWWQRSHARPSADGGAWPECRSELGTRRRCSRARLGGGGLDGGANRGAEEEEKRLLQ